MPLLSVRVVVVAQFDWLESVGEEVLNPGAGEWGESQVRQFADQDVREECDGYCVLCRLVRSVAELVRVEGGREAGPDVVENQPFQALGDDGCECNWEVVLVAEGG